MQPDASILGSGLSPAGVPQATPSLPSAPAPTVPSFRHFGDNVQTRKLIFDNVLSAAQKIEPVSNPRHSLSIENPRWSGPDSYSLAEQKQAVLSRGTLGRKLVGDVILRDTAGNVLGQRSTQLARVPYMTDRGTFIMGGNEYTMAHQMRLKPGVFTRRKRNGELESHVNVSKGFGHRIFLDPETGVFRIAIGQAKIPLVPLLRTMGISDGQMRDTWGNELSQVNMAHADPQAIGKLYRKLHSHGTAPELEQKAAVAQSFNDMTLDPEVTKRTLGQAFSNVGPATLMAATQKLLRVARGEDEPDDRDALAYQHMMGPEDLFPERLLRAKSVARQLLWKASARGNLDGVSSNAYDEAIKSALMGSGLGMPLEEINPADIFDQQARVTRMGEGGIPSLDAVPDEARSVQPSQFGFIDFLRTPESGKVGVDARIARAAVKGQDGKIYTQVRTPTGEMVYKTPQEIADATVAFPNETKRNEQYIAALQNGKVKMVPRHKVDFEIPDMENTFSPLGNLIPMKSMVKGQRAVMAARMVTQALPLKDAEAPHVQSGMPGVAGRSFEQEYAKHMGAVHADAPARILSVEPDGIKMVDAQGQEKTVPLYNNFPYNRKTFIHQTATVQPGDVVQPGQLLARSNFTDGKGVTALGLNARVAYVPWGGLNFEDANLVSQSFAKRMTSEHMYQHQHEWEDHDHQGRNAFVSMFPSTYDRKTLANFDEHGIVKPGTVVRHGDPLILIGREKERNRKSLLKGTKPSYQDATQTWEHEDEGIVTDVVKTPKGASVVVKAHVPMQVGDKLSGRYGDKGIVSHIIPDDQMPHDAQGKPYEVLLNPLGVISRCYDEDTEFFTDDGWKLGIDILQSNMLMEYDPVTQTIRMGEQQAPMYIAEYKGQMLNYMDHFVVTPDHKMIVDEYDPDIMYFAGRDAAWREVQAIQARQMKACNIPVVIPRFLKKLNSKNVCTMELRANRWTTIDYDGFIFCPTVSTGYVVTRRGQWDNRNIVCLGNTNPAQIVEAALGKIAAARGEPFKIPDFQDEDDMIEFALKELHKSGLTDTEHITDPTNGRVVPDVFTGNRWFMKLHHTSESKGQGRGLGSYTAEMAPAKGGPEGAKRIGMLETNALLSHGATEIIRGGSLIRGQSNPQFWAQYMSGFKPPTPAVPHVYNKFVNSLRASGINVIRDGTRTHIMALTDKDIDAMAGGRALRNVETVDWRNMEPIPGGLFDKELTGGHASADGGGNRWSYIPLHEPMPSPVMEEPIRRVLGLTTTKFNGIIAGTEKLNGQIGPRAIASALDNLDINKELDRARAEIQSGKKTARDDAVRRLGYLKNAQRLGIHPREWIISKAPVLPPAFRPVSTMGPNKLPLVADPNYLYKELWDSNTTLGDMSLQLDDKDLGDERLATYNAFKAVTGLGDPTHPKNQERQVKGILKHVFGTSPKLGVVQRRLLGSTTDLVGRAVIAPDPDLDMDQVGVPENQAWTIYRPILIRRLVRRGMPRLQAAHAVEERSEVARKALLDEMDSGVVVINRAPTLHRYGMMAARPKLVKGNVLKISPLVVGGFGADFDGDAMQYHVPVTDEEKHEALEKMLPSRNLLSAATFKIHYTPSQEYIGGLYESSARIDHDKPPMTFATVADAVRAHGQGRIGVGRRVEIHDR